jgi:hypothetical protein
MEIPVNPYLSARFWLIAVSFSPILPVWAYEKVLFESPHIRFVEVTHWQGRSETVRESLPAVVAVDAMWPALAGSHSAQAKGTGGKANPPDGRMYPWCQTQAGLPERTVTVTEPFPQHYYRIDYKRVDGDDYAANWRSWYPWLLSPGRVVADLGKSAAGQPHSNQWPYPIAYDAVSAAPANHSLRYEDDHVQLLEVAIRPGEHENMHGHPYPSVFADDGGGFSPVVESRNERLDPKGGNPRGAMASAPGGAKYPTCYAAVPEGPHSVTVTGKVPNHFYRIHFKRVDGEEIKANWKSWYPEMQR